MGSGSISINNKNKVVILIYLMIAFVVSQVLLENMLPMYQFGPKRVFEGLHRRFDHSIRDRLLATNRARKAGRKPVEKGGDFLMLYYNPSRYLLNRIEASDADFSLCHFNNCQLTFNKASYPVSDAVIFHGQNLKDPLPRPPGQVWVFSGHESPRYYRKGKWWVRWKSVFNWTMTYDKRTADIYFPYGNLLHRQSPLKTNFTEIYRSKTKEVLMISSHCRTVSQREKFVKKLQMYVDVDVLGRCGGEWSCGRKLVHDECFSILNNYKFYLAFENSLCRSYFTEKVFENFDYNTLLVVRGGGPGETLRTFPNGSVISTDSFESIEALGEYLHQLSKSEKKYTSILERKSQFYFPGYKLMFQGAMCQLCEKLNRQTEHRQVIPDIRRVLFSGNPCRNPLDIPLPA